MASVRCEGISKSFGNVSVLKDIDLSIEDGELVVFVGPSGCGKTTLLRVVAGLEDVSAGSLYVGPQLVNDLQPKDRNIAMVFQNYAIYPHMTVAENIGFGMKIRGSSREERDTAVSEAARLLGLSDLLDRRPKQLSGGQRQRVAMGRAIVRNPSVFLLDEPLSNLDAELRNQMRVEIKSLQHRLRTTMVYVTHDQIEAMTLADRIAVMKDGEIRQFGSPRELYTSPTHKFVAGFIGTPRMNFIGAEVVAARELMLENGCRMHLPSGHEPGLPVGSRVDVGVRPEDLRIAHRETAKAPDESIRWRAPVSICEELGGETIVHLGSLSEPLQVKVHGATRVSEGDQVDVAFDVASVHLFDARDGYRVGHLRAN